MRRTTRTIAAALLVAGPAFAQEVLPRPNNTTHSDLLDQTRRMQQVAVQKAEADARMGLQDAASIAKTDRKKAVDRLNQLLVTLDADRVLPADRRETLLRIVRDRIRVTEASALDAEAVAATNAQLEGQRKALADAANAAAAERKEVKQELEALVQLRQSGRATEAASKAAELAKKYPENAAVQAFSGTATRAANLAEGQAVKAQRESGVVAALTDIDRAATLPKGDIEFPADWKERSAKRLAGQGVSPQELRMLNTLNAPIRPDFKGTRLQTAVDYLSTLTGQTILLEKSALDEAQITYDTPVTFAPQTEVSTRTALRTVLSSVNLTYVVRDNVMFITTPQRARELMVTKAYYLGDLVTGISPLGGAVVPGYGQEQVNPWLNANAFVSMIQETIDPQSWQGRGGSGVVGFNPPTMSLIVRQSSEVHALIRSGLYGKQTIGK